MSSAPTPACQQSVGTQETGTKNRRAIMHGYQMEGIRRPVAGDASWSQRDNTVRRHGKSTPEEVLEVRRRHGYKDETDGIATRSIKSWRDDVLSGRIKIEGVEIPKQTNSWPKNAPILDELERRFAVIGFRWKRNGRMDTLPDRINGGTRQVERRWVEFENAPAIGGHTLDWATAMLVPPEMVDGYEDSQGVSAYASRVGTSAGMEAEAAISRMNATRIGYKGFTKVSWGVALEPLVLPSLFLDRLGAIARALALGFEAIRELWDTDPSLQTLLTRGKPGHIPALMLGEHVGLIRPDITIVKDPKTGELRPVITELESCPAGQGMAHAMEVGYELPTTMVDAYLRLLAGRRYIVYATHQWSEYVFDQAVFVQALRDRGVNAEIWFDQPLEKIHDNAQRDWTPHPDIPAEARAGWNRDFLGRLKCCGFDTFVHGSDDGLPETLGPETVVFRFGYFDNFRLTHGLTRLQAWHAQGATIMNQLWFALESKALMGAFWLPAVEAWIRQRDPDALTALHNGLAETHPVHQRPADVLQRPHEWTTKIAAWDGDNRSWGARGVAFGSQAQSDEKWEEHVEACKNLPYATVVQRFILSHRISMPWCDEHGRVQILRAARTRLTPFFLFQNDGQVTLAGSTITLRRGSLKIHGAHDAVEGPVVYENPEISQ